MNSFNLYNKTTLEIAKKITTNYSTSFSIGTRLLGASIRDHIYAIYGFVRVADEIVDTFHQFDKQQLLDEFTRDTYLAIDRKISTNPVLHSFQHTVNTFNIDRSLIDAFLKSMSFDLDKSNYDESSINEYIYGSAEVVGLMCLQIFVNGNKQQFEQLKPYAQSLGAAFQKVNFLRDIGHDYNELGRSYFPGIDINHLSEENISSIFKDIEHDFQHALTGINRLLASSKFGVYVAYVYYYNLFEKLKKNKHLLMKKRIRISNSKKLYLIFKAWFKLKAVSYE
ncbi:MAG TPA: phytoene synthase [Flavobacteriales bacterium]|nr:phytoene synthase [Flavobacteriales bacterium]|tara:strand:- start:23974 stop:24816 length:843 start_codon:yes stop_codon:yes gene_type:complete